MTSIEIVAPDKKYQPSVLAAIKEFEAEGATGMQWYYGVGDDFDAYVAALNARQTTETDTMVPESVYWAICEGEFAGRISIRHKLNEALKKHGGHIGYDVRPSFRRRGIATEMLRLALAEAKKLGIENALLTCADTNIPSIKVIERWGGVLEKKSLLQPENKMARYYWITV